MNKIVYSKDLILSLKDSYLFLDTAVLIAAINYKAEFSNLFQEIRDSNVNILTIPSVLFEFTRGSSTRIDFNRRSDFLSTIADIYPIERHLDQMEQEIILLQKFSNTASYTDFLLVMCLLKFPKSFLITENHKDMPMALLERKHIIKLTHDLTVEVLLRSVAFGGYCAASSLDLTVEVLRFFVINIDTERQIRNQAIYSLSKSKYQAQMSKLK